MKWSCSAVRRRLPEYHDGELAIEQRVAIQNHLSACSACAAEAEALNTVRLALHEAAVERACALDLHDLDGLAVGVVSRLRAERDESFPYTVQRMFEDLHLVWAALSATAATVACLAITVGIFYFSKAERPDSLAAVMNALSNPGSNANPVQVTDNIDQVSLPRQDLERVSSVPEVTTDEEIMLDATITREGRVSSLQLMTPEGTTGQASPETDWKSVGRVLDSVAQARFAPARVGGLPVAVKMFWYLTHTTVVGKARDQVQHGRPVAPHIVATTVV